MKWHKVEDYPVESEPCVLVSQVFLGSREKDWCFVASMKKGYWISEYDFVEKVQPTDRWCYINLPKD